MSKDPVCGMTVDDGAKTRSTYRGRTFVFCSPGCKDRFDKEPERYVDKREHAGQAHAR